MYKKTRLLLKYARSGRRQNPAWPVGRERLQTSPRNFRHDWANEAGMLQMRKGLGKYFGARRPGLASDAAGESGDAGFGRAINAGQQANEAGMSQMRKGLLKYGCSDQLSGGANRAANLCRQRLVPMASPVYVNEGPLLSKHGVVVIHGGKRTKPECCRKHKDLSRYVENWWCPNLTSVPDPPTRSF